MKKRTAFIGAILSLIPLGHPLLIKTGVVLSPTGLMLSIPEKVNAETANFYFVRAYEKVENGDYYGAISDYTKAIEINPNFSLAYSNRAASKERINDPKGALDDYIRALEIEPNSYISHQGVGWAKNVLGDYSGAIIAFNKSIEINPNNACLLYTSDAADE